MGLLDNTYRKAKLRNPREMIIFSYPKVGKTSLVEGLPGKHVCFDFDGGGADYYDGNFVTVPNYKTFIALQKEFIEKKEHYDIIVLDTLTSLYDNLCNQIAVSMYNKDNNTKKPLSWDITTLAYGLGQKYLRTALQNVLKFFRKYCDTLIVFGHAADKALDGSDSSSMTSQELAIDGKLKHIISLKTDALGLLYRSADNENTLSFLTSSAMVGGTRIPHLRNKEFVISELDPETEELTTYWDKVFLPKKENTK